MIETPRIADSESRPAAVIHLTIPRERCQDEFPAAVQELLEVLGHQGLQPAGPLFDHHLAQPAEVFDFEVGFPVHGAVAPAGRVAHGTLPAAKVVRTVHHGGYEGLPNAWSEFREQAADLVAASGLARGDTLWQVYLVGPADDPDPRSWRTELNAPLVDLDTGDAATDA